MHALHNTAFPRCSGSPQQRGATLVEALVALLVMSVGMLTLVGLMSNLRFSADLAQQRSEALRIARADIATLRAYAELSRATGHTPAAAQVYSDIATLSPGTPQTPADANTSYTLERTVSHLTNGGQGLVVRTSVHWTDRADTAQVVSLDTVIARVDPVFSAAVALGSRAGAVMHPSARSPLIPDVANKLNEFISAFRPSSLDSTVWIFNNLSGTIVGRCSVAVGTPVSTLTASDVAGCSNNTIGYLLRGTISFSNTLPANPRTPEAHAIPLGLDIVADRYLLPRLDAGGNPQRDVQGVLLTTAYTATPPSFDCFNDAPANAASVQPVVNYHCIVYPTGTPLAWSGKLVLTGFKVGTTAATHRVCRYSADYDGSGDMDTADKKSLDNTEHPPVYGRVTGSLAGQNFLVVRGDLACPSAPAVNPAGGVFADYTTLQLQP